MPKRTPLPCTADNCGDIFPRCGRTSTYTNGKCRCDSCHAAISATGRRYREANREKIAKRMKRYEAENREANREKRAEYKKQWYLENRARLSDRQKQYYQDNREEIIERTRQYYAENREACSERNKRWSEANRDKVVENYRRYREDNREALLEKNKKYREANREAVAESIRRWAIANPERARDSGRRSRHRRRARLKEVQFIDFTLEQFEQRMAYYGHACYLKLDCCTGEFDHVDHVKPIAKLGPHILANLRPACQPCNLRKAGKWPFKVAA